MVWSNKASLLGPAGATGATGPTGDKGPTGDTGASGTGTKAGGLVAKQSANLSIGNGVWTTLTFDSSEITAPGVTIVSSSQFRINTAGVYYVNAQARISVTNEMSIKVQINGADSIIDYGGTSTSTAHVEVASSSVNLSVNDLLTVQARSIGVSGTLVAGYTALSIVRLGA